MVIINSLQFFVKNKQVRISAFVIMSNHIHLIWQAEHGYHLKDVQTSFKKFTSSQFLKLTKAENNEAYKVSSADRSHHFWKRNLLGTELFTPEVFEQKMIYIHENPVRAGICRFPEEYKYSSAEFYVSGIDRYELLRQWFEHYKYGRRVGDRASALKCGGMITNRGKKSIIAAAQIRCTHLLSRIYALVATDTNQGEGQDRTFLNSLFLIATFKGE